MNRPNRHIGESMDIVEHLRYRASCNAGFDDGDAFKEAADEIERLRADTHEVAAARAFLRERDGLLREIAALRATIEVVR